MTATQTDLSAKELAAVAARMSGAGVALAGPLRASRIAGGRSNITIQLSDGADRWVLRMPPRTGRTPSAHDVAREFRATAALRASDVPVPPAVLLCEDESVLGAPFAVAGYVSGRSVQTREELDALDDGRLAQVVDRLVETLARLHRVDYVAVGLGRFGRPDAYAERQLSRWASQWELVGEAFPLRVRSLAVDLLVGLRRALPEQRSTGVVHGDFRIDNTLLDLEAADGPRVAAVVDWELSTIGDPVADLAMMCAYRDPAFDRIVGARSAWTSPRLPSPEELVERYARSDGVPLVDLAGHLALAHFKVAVIAAGIDHRFRAGSGAGAGFESAGTAVEPFLVAASDLLAGAR